MKAVFWWSHALGGCEDGAREARHDADLDADIDFLFSVYSACRRVTTEGRSGATGSVGGPPPRDPYPFWLD